MLINYIKTAYRNIIRDKIQTLINVLGLAIGMTCAILIFLWVQNQTNYDKWQKNKENIYRLETKTWVTMPPYLGNLIKDLPEVKNMARLYFWRKPTITYKENIYNTRKFLYADSTLFDIFNFEFIYGKPENALRKPFSIVLTENMSSKIFGKENPVGKEILLDNKHPYIVSAVIKNIKNLHFDFNAVTAAQNVNRINGNNNFLEAHSNNFLIYLFLNSNVNINHLTKKIKKLVEEYHNIKELSEDDYFLLRPFESIYFERGLPYENHIKHGNISLVIIFSAISFLILLIACINFINITTAKANLREKEIAVRKILGATRNRIAKQFLGETLSLVIIAHVLSIVILELILPTFNSIINENISFNYFSAQFIFIATGTITITTLLAGFYPSLYLSSLNPILLLKGKSGQNKKGSFRKILMLIQFSVSIFLIIATIVIGKQLNFVLNKNLGWNKDNILFFETRNMTVTQDAFKKKLFENPNIKNISFIMQPPGGITNTWTWDYNGESCPAKIVNTDPDFISTLGLKLIEGRNFSYDNPADYKKIRVIVNETLVKKLNLKNPIGTLVEENHIEIIGVVKDFNFNSLHNKIDPLGIRWYPYCGTACVRISGNNIPKTIKYIESIHNEMCPKSIFEYKFMDDTFAKQYENEVRQSKILIFFACLTIFLAALGLLGMSTFIITTRIKEIGIRKALGSSTTSIIKLILNNFVTWVFISFVITSPISYWLLIKWLNQYPYKTVISWWVFIVALIITLSVVLITIGYQITKAARTNPVDCLRYE